ncbi:MAG TPA: recombinase family protein, partial [Actinomycetes bacterium]|nr:recombinase family protein [Actinomycetes bacterium]
MSGFGSTRRARAMQAGIYARLSVVRNGEPTREIETPTERQVADGERYCKSKSWDVADRYVDAGLSGYKEVYRPEFERLLRDVQARRIQVIVCWKLDRLCRNHADFQRLWKVCERAGASLVSVQESFDTTTPHGEFVVRLLIGMAKLESQNISLRVSRALQAVAESGRPRIGGNYRAFGYADDGVTVIPREAAAIQEAARRLLKGEPVRAIARDLNDRNLYRVTGKPWTGSLLADTLGRARNAGLREYHGAVVGEAGWPAILDRPTWEQVVATLRHPGRRSQQGRPRTHLLAGMVWCGIEGCGAKMTSRP